MYLNIMLSQVLIAMNRQSSWTWVMAATTVVNPLFNLGLIPFTDDRYGNGAIGAAIALLLTEMVVVAAGITLIGRHVFARETVGRAALGTLAAGVAWSAGWLTRGSIGGFPALILAALSFAGAAALLRVFPREEIDLMRQGLRKVTRRLPGLRRSASAAVEAP